MAGINGQGSRTCVLVVDDAEQNRTLITAWLMGRPGTHVASVNAAGAAIAHMRREHVDIVLLDMVMPGIDGYAAARLLRALPEARKVPIVAITAKVGDDERAACLAAGCTEYLSKPFSKSALHALIDRLVPAPAVSAPAIPEAEAPRALDAEVQAALDRETQALVPAYLENRCAEVIVLESALEKSELDTLRTIGHNLRGSGGSYGFPTLTEIGERIESAAKAADLATLTKEVAHLREHLTDVMLSRGT